jgi:glycosyltransferase involved in cell wall biosynthesis
MNGLEVADAAAQKHGLSRVMGAPRPRVLHVLGSLALGGIETWLMHMLRRHDQFEVQHEVLVTKQEPGAYHAEARRLGIPVHTLPINGNKIGWFREFKRYLAEAGPFDIVHSHAAPHFTAPILAVAKAMGIPIRVAHSHSARSIGVDYSLKYRIARHAAIIWLRHVATRRIGITEAALQEIVGKKWQSDPLGSILIYGFDFSANSSARDRGAALRQQMAIPADAPVIGNVARFDPVKNHSFLMESFATLLKRVPNAQLVLVGTGPLQPQVAAQATSLGIAERVHFAGATDDVPAYMAMFDLFVLPSFSEGLGIVCVEAQAAGTRVLASDTTPPEAAVIPGGYEELPLETGAARWAEAMARLLMLPSPDAADWLHRVEKSKFAITRCIHELSDIYRSELERVG